ncbi:hypothetical protein [Salinisphaera shabanensis]|uniref:hypothetical protein n=1 Tax=Salinisphaera shabanensis TaxID=180542 RepID=UPI001930BBB3|nr:hypothetical protein [Salinisphaera shabanensis]
MEEIVLEARRVLAFAVLRALLQCGEDRGRVDTFVYVQRDGIHLEAGALGLAGPVEIRALHALQLFQRIRHHGLVTGGQRIVDEVFDLRPAGVELQRGVDMRVVGPLGGFFYAVGGGVHHAHMRIVRPFFVVAIAQDFVAIAAFLLFLPAALFWLGRGRLRPIAMEIELCRGGLGLELKAVIRVRGCCVCGDSVNRAAASTAFADRAVGNQRILESGVFRFAEFDTCVAQRLLHRVVAHRAAIVR